MQEIINTCCWVCGNNPLFKVRDSKISKGNLNSKDFLITSNKYGITLELSKCKKCGFIQASEKIDTLLFYENLVDHEYEKTRKERALQENQILRRIKKFKSKGKLLDVGAGSGILVEAATQKGFKAKGIEPSKWLAEKGKSRGINIIQGVLSESTKDEKFDVITIIDVLEHVDEPLKLLLDVSERLRNDGIGVLVVPNVESFAAKLLRWKWWHFRVAHIGYFSKKNVRIALEKVGLRTIKIENSKWYFSINYLASRLLSYLPPFIRFKKIPLVGKMIIPLNLYDSLLIFFKKN